MEGSFVVSQLGARMHYAVPRIFADHQRLAHFYTDICALQGWPNGRVRPLVSWSPPRAFMVQAGSMRSVEKHLSF